MSFYHTTLNLFNNLEKDINSISLNIVVDKSITRFFYSYNIGFCIAITSTEDINANVSIEDVMNSI